jgi:hypothetical protein
MAGKKKKKELSEESAVSDLPFDNSELKKISLCLGVLSLRLTHHKFKMDKDRIPFLTALGFNRHEIAAILCTTPLSVSVVQTHMKKKPKRNAKENVENQPEVA